MIADPADDLGRLDELDANEMFDVCRFLQPAMTREEFDERWAEFQAEKAKRKLQ
jgi:hypothetical protein